MARPEKKCISCTAKATRGLAREDPRCNTCYQTWHREGGRYRGGVSLESRVTVCLPAKLARQLNSIPSGRRSEVVREAMVAYFARPQEEP